MNIHRNKKEAAARVATSDSGKENITDSNITHSGGKVNHDPPPDICITCRAHAACKGSLHNNCKRAIAHKTRAEEKRLNGHIADAAAKTRSNKNPCEGRPGKNGYMPY